MQENQRAAKDPAFAAKLAARIAAAQPHGRARAAAAGATRDSPHPPTGDTGDGSSSSSSGSDDSRRIVLRWATPQ